MILLDISDNEPKHMQIVDQIQSLCLAHKVTTSNLRHDPVMIAYGKEYRGTTQIMDGLVELEQLVEKWYECQCDKYEDTLPANT